MDLSIDGIDREVGRISVLLEYTNLSWITEGAVGVISQDDLHLGARGDIGGIERPRNKDDLRIVAIIDPNAGMDIVHGRISGDIQGCCEGAPTIIYVKNF